MADFLADKLSVEFNGNWEAGEILALAALAVIAVLVAVGLIQLVKTIAERTNPRKSTIFSHRKNKYKNRIGKKNKY